MGSPKYSVLDMVSVSLGVAVRPTCTALPKYLRISRHALSSAQCHSEFFLNLFYEA